MLKNKKTYLIPIFGFAIIILIGAFLLNLPACNYTKISFFDALYTATSGVSTTGFTRGPLVSQFNFWGQLVLAVLMEIGAMGFIIFVSYFWSVRHKKMQMSDMMVINDNTSNDDTISVKEHSIFVGKFMFLAQLIGIVLLSIRFVPLLGVGKGIWYAIFHAISAFSNTGFDLFGTNGLRVCAKDIYTQFIFMALMFIGSIGVFVLEDLQRTRKFSKFKLKTKIVLVCTLILLIIPTILFVFLEDGLTVTNGLFLSVTARSTGFNIADVPNFSTESKILLTVLMFIGGAPASTSGGIKVITLTIIVATILSTLRGRSDTVIFWRKIPNYTVRMAFTIFTLFAMAVFIAVMLITLYNDVGMLNATFDCVSAISNTGLSITDISLFNNVGNIVLMVMMFIGRIGPLSLVLVFINKDNKEKFLEYPEENVIL